jgi:hypothetical protein
MGSRSHRLVRTGVVAALLILSACTPTSTPAPAARPSETISAPSPTMPVRASRDYWRPAHVDRPHPVAPRRVVRPHAPAPRVAVPARRPAVHRSTGGHWVALGTRNVTQYCWTGNRNSAGRWPALGDVAVLDRGIRFGTRVRISGQVYVVRDWVGHGTDFDIYAGRGACESRALSYGRHHTTVYLWSPASD